MARELKTIAFVVEDFSMGSPAQQMLDRFLIGYPRNGEFHRCGAEVHAWLAQGAEEGDLAKRVTDHSLHKHANVEETVAEAQGIVVVPRQVHAAGLVKQVIEAAPPGACVFVYGAIAGDAADAKAIVDLTASKKVALASGTSAAMTWRLPEVDVSSGAAVKRALVVVQGEPTEAELHGLDGLLPLLERRTNGERGVRKVTYEEIRLNDRVYFAGEEPLAENLLAAALSRSDSPQGDSVRDGRTQNLMESFLIVKLAKNPHYWLIEHTDGVRSNVVVLNGVVNDFNFAVELGDGSTVSAQIYRPPGPQRHEFSRVAEVVEKFFVSGKAPWPSRRSVLTSGLLAAFARAGEAETPIRTPELEF